MVIESLSTSLKAESQRGNDYVIYEAQKAVKLSISSKNDSGNNIFALISPHYSIKYENTNLLFQIKIFHNNLTPEKSVNLCFKAQGFRKISIKIPIEKIPSANQKSIKNY